MKIIKFILSVCVLSSFTIIIFGQTEQWGILIGGETRLDFSYLKEKLKINGSDAIDNGETTNFGLSAQLGLFVLDGFALGFKMPISTTSNYEKTGSSMTTLAFTPFVRYYFKTRIVKPYLHGDIGFGKHKMKTNAYTFSSSMFLYEIVGGIGIFLNKKISLDIGLGYSSQKSISKLSDIFNSGSSDRRVELGIGCSIIL